MANRFKSPLRYPGSKANLTEVIKTLVIDLKLDGLPVCEPYAGSAAVSIELVVSGVAPSAHISEKDPLIYAFWKVVFTNPKPLIQRILSTPITLKTWHEFRPLLEVREIVPRDVGKLAFAGLFFNRTNFSGVINSGPIGGQSQASEYPIHCRFNREELVTRIEALAKWGKKFTVTNDDALVVLSKHRRKKGGLFYIDPPYFMQGRKLYRFHYGISDHVKLAAELKKAAYPWILSYDKHVIIENLYEDFHHAEEEFKYSSRMPKTEKELLITNRKRRAVNG
jgi:DNA adenine methylase